jgi:hypothetical protein
MGIPKVNGDAERVGEFASAVEKGSVTELGGGSELSTLRSQYMRVREFDSRHCRAQRGNVQCGALRLNQCLPKSCFISAISCSSRVRSARSSPIDLCIDLARERYSKYFAPIRMNGAAAINPAQLKSGRQSTSMGSPCCLHRILRFAPLALRA